jgi:hypothetical protein
VPGVPAAVATFAVLLETIHNVHLGHPARSLQVTDQVLALGVDVRVYVVRDFPGGVAQADPLIDRWLARGGCAGRTTLTDA